MKTSQRKRFSATVAEATATLNRIAQAATIAAGKPVAPVPTEFRRNLWTPPAGVILSPEYWSARELVRNAKRMAVNYREDCMIAYDAGGLHKSAFTQQRERIERAMARIPELAETTEKP